jgi:hypothetical protein
MIHNRLRRPLSIVVGILAIIGIGAAAMHYFIPAIRDAFLTFPLIVALHVIPAGIWMTLAPFQLVKRIRSRWLNYHRWAGRVLAALGLMVGAAALFMAWVIPIVGWPERVIIGFFGVLFLVALSKGFLHARARQILLHREWMIRAFAIALAISTVRLIEIPLLIAVGVQSLQAIYIIANGGAFTLHAVVAEVWIRTGRRKRISAVGAASVPVRGQVDVVG